MVAKMFALPALLGCVVVVLLLRLRRADASSSADDIWICRADDVRFGCRTGWGTKIQRVCPLANGPDVAAGRHALLKCHDETVVNRGDCLDEPANETIMSWVAAPVLSADGFELRARRDHLSGVAAVGASAEATEPLPAYRPGRWFTLVLRTLRYDLKYRGLLLHADDADGNKVGEWGLPELLESPFWHPDACGPKTVLHSGADVKSLTSSFRFRGPPVGTGPITFKALIKVGPANRGEFYRPNDLVLPEAAPSSGGEGGSKWILGPAGATCDEACGAAAAAAGAAAVNGQHVCDESIMAAGLKTPASAAAALSSVYPCNGPLIVGCHDMAVPLTTALPAHRRCWYQADVCAATPTGALTAAAASTGREVCAANTSASMRRFCACNNASPRMRRRVLRSAARSAAAAAIERKAADLRLKLENAAASSWEMGSGPAIHGTVPHENWTPSGEFWYNPMTGAILASAPVRPDSAAAAAAAAAAGDDGSGGKHSDNDNGNTEPLLAFSAGARSHGAPHRLTAMFACLMMVMLPLVPAAGCHRRRRSPALSFTFLLIGFTVVLLSLAPPPNLLARAHNWLETPRRGMSRGKAVKVPSISTSLRCIPRTIADVHYQVGPGQQFAVKFSTGHHSRYFFMVVPGSEVHRLNDPKIIQIAWDYMNSAPPGTNKASVKGLRRIRDAIGNRPNGFRFEVNIDETHEEWLEHPDYPNRYTKTFKDDYVEWNDKRFAYQSEKYPWLEAVQSYTINVNNPFDYDVIPVGIPGFHGVGHYVVWFKWYGYSGCIDVEYFEKPVPFPCTLFPSLFCLSCTSLTPLTTTHHIAHTYTPQTESPEV